ncbi:MAG TPA: hypothetical protein VK508_15365 [Cyclobacteriaceae bacterium]|nr:hypothetical protein [Cyclobacteriaceae bacterium]
MSTSYSNIEFPRAFAFAIDDLGWNEGSSLATNTPRGPHRAGVKRTFNINDYRYIIDVAKAVGVRVQCLFVLGEMDRENVLAKYPTTTNMKERWNNRALVNDRQIAIMKYVRDEAAAMEFGFHGTGHEYWPEDNIQRRAEWYNLIDRTPWPEESLRGHIEAFGEILAQYDLSRGNGHSFPETFVPCAYSYYWNPNGDYSLGALMTEAGVKYANTDFGQIPELNPPIERNGGGFDHGLHVINRNNYGNPWYALSCLPNVTLDLQYTDVIESHWPNWLAQDDFLQRDVTEQWVNYYRSVQRYNGRYIAKNTEQLHSQWLYNKYTRVAFNGLVEIDNTQMPGEAYRYSKPGNMVLKIGLNPGEHVSSALINGELLPAYLEDQGFAFLYLPPLEKKKYTLKYEIGKELMPVVVYNDGTYNVYKLSQTTEAIKINARVYGSTVLKVRCDKPLKMTSDNTALVLEKMGYDEPRKLVSIHVKALDFQGVTGNIILNF